MKLPLRSMVIGLLAGIFITFAGYVLTMRSTESCCDINFRNSVEMPFYASVRAGQNTYNAGFPFGSTATYYYPADGCPCAGIGKVYLLPRFVPSWQFAANLILWSSLPYTVVYLKGKKK